MMIMKSNAKGISNTLNKLPTNLKKGYINSIKKAAEFGEQIAKSLAPVKSGTLKGGIYSRTFKNNAEILSSVPGSFPYNLWVNRTPPFDKLNFKRWNRYFSFPQQVMYGNDARSKSGSPIMWTGMPGYMDVTVNVVDKKLIKSINDAVANVLNIR